MKNKNKINQENDKVRIKNKKIIIKKIWIKHEWWKKI
jgi:hypothetical protein